MVISNARIMMLLQLIILLAISTNGCVAQISTEQNISQAREFIEQFYNWYPEASLPNGPKMVTWGTIAQDPDGVFSPELSRMLLNDIANKKANSGYVVGLEFDPLLNAQDICDNYVVRNIAVVEDAFRGDIWADCGQETFGDHPLLTVEVIKHDQRYYFSNFYYPNRSVDLVTLLERIN
ncbi:MAG: hypothetical protein LBG44_05290 [Gemmatimonadota bacterium]|jgi:hypothetical protein|nr:hypothetical protein [Gemmatimonadota bacterium]